MELTVVYEASIESYIRLMQVLRDEGFNPVALDNPYTEALYVPRGGYRKGAKFVVYVAVPRDEAFAVKSVLRKWKEAQREKVDIITNKLRNQLFYSFLIAVGTAVIFYLLGSSPEDSFLFLLLIWFASFILIANGGKISRIIKGSTAASQKDE